MHIQSTLLLINTRHFAGDLGYTVMSRRDGSLCDTMTIQGDLRSDEAHVTHCPLDCRACQHRGH